jgi:hypothetical protein
VTPRRADGAQLLGARDLDKLEECVSSRLCQLCGGALMSPMVFLLPRTCVRLQRGGLIDARTGEPAFHPHCATYAISECPTLARRLVGEATRPEPSASDLGPCTGNEHGLPKIAHFWLEVWVDRYEVVPSTPEKRAAALLATVARRARPLADHPRIISPAARTAHHQYGQGAVA